MCGKYFQQITVNPLGFRKINEVLGLKKNKGKIHQISNQINKFTSSLFFEKISLAFPLRI